MFQEASKESQLAARESTASLLQEIATHLETEKQNQISSETDMAALLQMTHGLAKDCARQLTTIQEEYGAAGVKLDWSAAPHVIEADNSKGDNRQNPSPGDTVPEDDSTDGTKSRSTSRGSREHIMKESDLQNSTERSGRVVRRVKRKKADSGGADSDAIPKGSHTFNNDNVL